MDDVKRFTAKVNELCDELAMLMLGVVFTLTWPGGGGGGDGVVNVL